ncbi:MAG: response regulator transcription factor [Calditrichaeota bacterium]|nr:response regulator transcription factor [Calditrichota bacterium]MCB0268746.1 response regulator transcription factor [Calditrichota bacterium]
MSIQLLLVDDHEMVREGFRLRLDKEPDIQILAEANNAVEAIRLSKELEPDIVLMDIAFTENDINGIVATRKIKIVNNNIQIIALSTYSDLVYVKEMFNAGARGYVLKEGTFSDLIKAIRTVAKGQIYVSESVNSALLTDFFRSKQQSLNPPKQLLTRQEVKVLQFIAKEYNPKEIADKLSIQVKTVIAHRTNLKKKLGISTEAGLTKYALREAMITLDD